MDVGPDAVVDVPPGTVLTDVSGDSVGFSAPPPADVGAEDFPPRQSPRGAAAGEGEAPVTVDPEGAFDGAPHEVTPSEKEVIRSVGKGDTVWEDGSEEGTRRYQSLFHSMIFSDPVGDIYATESYKNPVLALDLEDVRKTLRWLSEAGTDSLVDRFLATDSAYISSQNDSFTTTRCSNSQQRFVDPEVRTSLLQMTQHNNSIQRPPNKQLFRRKLLLLGHQEVGKTSLRKCFESEPYFFKSLPEVRVTTGVEFCDQSVYVGKDSVELTIQDFAGQGSYHSHTCFMTERTIFLFVWKISSVEQAFQGSGISVNEGDRLCKWIGEVYAKFPRAKVALVATHLDELRVQDQRSVENILLKVEERIMNFMRRIATLDPTTGERVMNQIVGNFAVSCKTRRFIAAGHLRHLSGQTLKNMLQFFAEVAHRDCMEDEAFPAGAIPGRHIKLLEEVEEKKRRFPNRFLMPLKDFIHSAVQLGVGSDTELLHVARLMHSWDRIYLFNSRRFADNTFIMLHPLWLKRLATALFSYAHVLCTPPHLRSVIGSLEYTVSQAEAADRCLIRKGFLRWPLVRALFRSPLSAMLGRDPDDLDYTVAVRLLAAQSLLVPVEVPCEDFSILEEETPIDIDAGLPVVREAKVTRYFVPSLSPYCVPDGLKRLAPVLFNRGIKLKFEFNFLPDEAWWRLQARLHSHQQIITLHEPRGALFEEEEEGTLDGHYHLFEAEEEHNQWNDAMWLKGDLCRTFLYREGVHVIRIFSTRAKRQREGEEEMLEVVEKIISDILEEYSGVQRKVKVECREPSCDGWLLLHDVLTGVEVSCQACGQTFSTSNVIASVVRSCGHRQFNGALLKELGELLCFSLSQQDCVELCEFFGIEYQSLGLALKVGGNNDDDNDNTRAPMRLYPSCMCALDKIVRAAMLRQMHERIERRVRCRRMLEQTPSQP